MTLFSYLQISYAKELNNQIINDRSALDNVSHIIIDEIQEYDVEIEFLLLLLKRIERYNREKMIDFPKLILIGSNNFNLQKWTKWVANIIQTPSLSSLLLL